MKHTLVTAIMMAVFSFPGIAASYVLPEYHISDAQMALPAEDVLASYDAELGDIYKSVRISKIREYERNPKTRLSPSERKAAGKYRALETPLRFWNYVVDLKRELLALPGASGAPAANAEADLMSKLIIQEIYDISQRYQVGFTALFRNFEINRKSESRGFCYHYVGDMLKVLMPRTWTHFDLHWGEAHPKTILENNSLVITAADEPFESGVMIDAWRTGGRPFWRSVAGDRFPWQEAPLAIYE